MIPYFSQIGKAFGSSYWTKLIKDLNPIFWIEDTTVIVDGKLVDKSGNNKQIAVSTVGRTNDTITMPANDTDIINALKADGMYDYFYTDDSTPNPCMIGQITSLGARRMYSQYSYKNFFLLASAPTTAQIIDIYNFLGTDKMWIPIVNIAKQLNFNRPINPDTLIGLSSFDSQLKPDDPTIGNNIFAWSGSRKTQTASLPGTGALRYANVFSVQRISGGSFKLSFWINRTEIGAGNYVVCYISLSYTGGTAAAMHWLDSDLNILGKTGTGVAGDYTYTTTVKDITGDYSRVEIEVFIPLYHFYYQGGENPAANSVCIVQIGLDDPTPAAQDFKVIDLVLVKDYTSAIVSGDILQAPYDIMLSSLLGKNICLVGDSITLGGNYALKIQYDYGLKKIYNCGQGGRRMAHVGTDDLWQDLATVIVQPAEILTILASANDGGSPIGDIDSVDDATYMGAYNNYLTYLLANLPVENEKVILITAPFIVGAGNTIPEGKALYQQQFINMANGVKALGVKYNLPVCDLHGLMPMTFDNSDIFLGDGVHWNVNMHNAAADIIGKFINDLYTYVAPVIYPKIVSTIVYCDTASTKLVITFDGNLDESSVPATTDFTITDKTITNVEVLGAVVTLTVSVAFSISYEGMLGYTKPVSDQLIRLSDAVDVLSFSEQEITLDSVVLTDLKNGDTKFWLASQALSTITKDAGTGEVSSITDKIGSGLALIQDTATKYPIWSADGILFDGINDFIRGVFTYNQPASYYLLIKVLNWSTPDHVIIDGGSVASCFLGQQTISPKVKLWAGTELYGIDLPLNVWCVVRIIFNGVNSSVQVNDGVPLTGDAGTNNPAGITIGSWYWDGGHVNLQIKEGIFRMGLDTAGKISNLYNHLFNQI